MTMIQIEGLELVRPGSFRLGPLDLTIQRGSRTALVGPSGSGKTTLLRCLAGLERLCRGSIHIEEKAVQDGGSQVAPGERGIGMVFQDGALWPHLNAVQHLRFVAPSLSKREATERLEQVGLSHVANRHPGSLSGGEVQRLALARALASKPKILLLDEPLHSVDAPLRDELCILIQELADAHDLTLVLVTHAREEALAIADRLVVMKNGAIVEEGDSDDILLDPQTAFAATFLARATCFPTEPGPDGLKSVFGEFPHREARSNMSYQLVLLPGEAVLAHSGIDGPKGRVLSSVRRDGSWESTISLNGHALRVPSQERITRGTEVALQLTGQPRFLPVETENDS